MLKTIRTLLCKIIDDIDCGNSNMSDEDALEVIDYLKRYTRKDKLLSKYQAYTLLNMSRASFDNKVKEGLIPKGIKVAGFKELMWKQSELNKLIKENRK